MQCQGPDMREAGTKLGAERSCEDRGKSDGQGMVPLMASGCLRLDETDVDVNKAVASLRKAF